MKYIILTFALAVSCQIWSQHGHLNAGAVSMTQGAQLNFKNGADFVASSGYVKALSFTNGGTYANFYSGNISVTALHTTNAFGEPLAGSPAPGSFLELELVSLTGPADGAFVFWDDGATTPSITLPTGVPNPAPKFVLSEAALGAGQPGGDPFGHIHGRRMGLTKPGLYKLGVKVIDTSSNGSGGGPIHSPSDLLEIMFQAGYPIANITKSGEEIFITITTESKFTFTLQSSSDPGNSSSWVDHVTVHGNDKLQTLTVPARHNQPFEFYRIKVIPIPG